MTVNIELCHLQFLHFLQRNYSTILETPSQLLTETIFISELPLPERNCITVEHYLHDVNDFIHWTVFNFERVRGGYGHVVVLPHVHR
jgi:hypothetical protein